MDKEADWGGFIPRDDSGEVPQPRHLDRYQEALLEGALKLFEGLVASIPNRPVHYNRNEYQDVITQTAETWIRVWNKVVDFSRNRIFFENVRDAAEADLAAREAEEQVVAQVPLQQPQPPRWRYPPRRWAVRDWPLGVGPRHPELVGDQAQPEANAPVASDDPLYDPPTPPDYHLQPDGSIEVSQEPPIQIAPEGIDAPERSAPPNVELVEVLPPRKRICRGG